VRRGCCGWQQAAGAHYRLALHGPRPPPFTLRHCWGLNAGVRLAEGVKINKGLLELGNVINALTQGKKGQ
jgi:hypothetical protein